ncbi:MAG: hypothetical protein JSS68_15715 [Actinobacteria bacterium]|nr:hypothetical protein [Actinomycetota bacterium]
MVERLRALLERPLDPSVARSMLVLALAVGIGFAAVALIGGVGDRPDDVRPLQRDAWVGASAPDHAPSTSPPRSRQIVGQDAQDRPGTKAHRRAVREVDGHRALQHVPWRRGRVSVELVGAVGGRAALAVRGPDVRAARRGWTRFLGRYHDDGSSYLPRFRATKGARP